ncbi:MAG: GntR family transcriptional regulator, partial [Candidimonas sp.]
MTQLSSSNAGVDELWGSRMRVARATLHEAVADKLRHMIVEGVLTPGTRLNERTLCDALGTSRTPLREAMRVLATEGLVEIEPNRGASVAVMSEAEIDEAFELLGGLEALSGELACMRITEEELAELKREHDEMLACHRNEDL